MNRKIGKIPQSPDSSKSIGAPQKKMDESPGPAEGDQNVSTIDTKIAEERRRAFLAKRGLDTQRAVKRRDLTDEEVAQAEAVLAKRRAKKIAAANPLESNPFQNPEGDTTDLDWQDAIALSPNAPEASAPEPSPQENVALTEEEFARDFEELGKEAEEKGPERTEKETEKMEFLRGKINEYKERLRALDATLVGADGDVLKKNPDRIFIQCKIAAAEYYIQHSEIDRFKVGAVLNGEGVPFDMNSLFDACALIDRYVQEHDAFGFVNAERRRRERAKKNEAPPADELAAEFPEFFAEKAETRGESVEAAVETDLGVVAEAIDESLARVDAAEKGSVAKITKNTDALAETLKTTADAFRAPNYFIDGAKNLARDLSHATLGTAVPGKAKRALNWLLGKKSETPTEKEHWGMLSEAPKAALDVARRLPEAFLTQMVDIPRDLSLRLAEWSSETTQQRRQLAEEMATRALEKRDRILTGIQKEQDALYRSGLSEENITRLKELADKSLVAEADYADTLAQGREIAPGALEGTLKHAAWATATFSLEALSFTAGMAGIIQEAGENLAKGIRGERKALLEERGGVLEIHENTPFGAMERLGEWMMTKARELNKDRAYLTETLHTEVTAAKQRTVVTRESLISGRIGALAEKTKLTQKDRAEIAQLTATLAKVQQGLLGAQEIDGLIVRAETLGKDAARKEDEKNLMGYLSGRAIQAVRNLEVIPPEARRVLIEELQSDPSPEALKTAESIIYTFLDENTRKFGVAEISSEQRVQLEQVHTLLKENIAQATDIYTASLTKISADLVKAIQATNRELKKAAAAAEMDGNDFQAAAK